MTTDSILTNFKLCQHCHTFSHDSQNKLHSLSFLPLHKFLKIFLDPSFDFQVEKRFSRPCFKGLDYLYRCFILIAFRLIQAWAIENFFSFYIYKPYACPSHFNSVLSFHIPEYEIKG